MMHRSTKRQLLATLTGLAILLASCKSPQEVQTVRESRMFADSDAWVGTYTGTLPCADCRGIRTAITLNKDLSYSLRTLYLGKSDDIHVTRGEFGWTPEGNVIVLRGNKNSALPAQYIVAENSLTQLDLNGNRITGPLADKYTLEKVQPGIVGKNWRLIEIQGQEVLPSSPRNEAYIMLMADENRITGSGGCNSFTGSYELREGSRIKVSKKMSTRKACDEMKVESELFKVLETADNYTLRGEKLILQKGSMSRLAVFEAEYLR